MTQVKFHTLYFVTVVSRNAHEDEDEFNKSLIISKITHQFQRNTRQRLNAQNELSRDRLRQTGEEDQLIMTQEQEQEHNQIWAQEGENTTVHEV